MSEKHSSEVKGEKKAGWVWPAAEKDEGEKHKKTKKGRRGEDKRVIVVAAAVV